MTNDCAIRLLSIARSLTWACKAPFYLACVLILVLMGVTLYDVIGRKFFATGSFKLQELEWHLHGAIVLLAIGYAYTRNAHVRIDLLAHRFSKSFAYTLEIAAIVLFVIPFCVFLIWYGAEFAWRAFASGEGSNGGLGLAHRWVIKSVVPVSAVFILLGSLSVALRYLVAWRRPDLLPDPFAEPQS